MWWKRNTKRSQQDEVVKTPEQLLVDEQIANVKSERRWAYVRRTFVGAVMVTLVGWYAYMLADARGALSTSRVPVEVPVVRIAGEISPESEYGAARVVIPALRRGFEFESDTLLLYVDSPGGSPSEADRIVTVIRDLKEQHPKKTVIAVCGSACASAAYMIAVQADVIVVGRYSIVGSIGALMATWNVSSALERLGIDHQQFASGPRKGLNNPFVPRTEDGDHRAKELVDEVADIFAEDVRQRRFAERDAEEVKALFTGDVWLGDESVRLGLADEVGTIDGVIYRRFGAKAGPRVMNHQPNFLQRLLRSAVTESVSAAVGTGWKLF